MEESVSLTAQDQVEEADGVQASSEAPAEPVEAPAAPEAGERQRADALAADASVVAESVALAVEAGAVQETPLSDSRTLKGILEALLFVTADPIPVTRFQALLGAATKQDVEQALAALRYDYEQEGRGLQLTEVAGGYRLATKAECAPWLKRLDKVKAPSKLSRSALESLAIIAYKQPIVRAEVEQIRGVETSGVIRTLLERKLVRIVGRKEEPGRPIMYGTTKAFLEHFGLRDLSQLPPLREFKELGESEQVMLPIEDAVEPVNGTLLSETSPIEAPEVVEEGINGVESHSNGLVHAASMDGDAVPADRDESESATVEIAEES